MTEKWKDEPWAQDFWYRGKVTRRSVVGWGGGAIGALMLVPAPWRAAFGAAAPFKIGSEQPLSGPGAAGGKTAVVGLQMAADRINKNGGINGRPVELVIVDDESKPDVGRRKSQKMVDEDGIDVHVGGFLSNICLACMPVWQEAKIVNMITVCLDTTLTTSACNRYTFRLHDYAPAQAVAFAPTLTTCHPKPLSAIVLVTASRSRRASRSRCAYDSSVSTSDNVARAAAIASGLPLNVPTCS